LPVERQRAERGERPIPYHCFPLHDENLLRQWKAANQLKDFVVTSSVRICSLHFQEDDYVIESKDSNPRRKRQRLSSLLSRKLLKPDAVPSLFPGLPEQLRPAVSCRRSENATASARLRNENSALEELIDSFNQDDDISALSNQELVDKLNTDEAVPSGYTYKIR
jgi:hypothetical protein